MKFINSVDNTRGDHSLSEEIKGLLQEKHPKAENASEDILLNITLPEPQAVIYEKIDENAVYKAAKQHIT